MFSCDVVSGEVTYRSKFLKSETYKKNIKANRIIVTEFGTMIYPDPCQNIFSRYRPSKIPMLMWGWFIGRKVTQVELYWFYDSLKWAIGTKQ